MRNFRALAGTLFNEISLNSGGFPENLSKKVTNWADDLDYSALDNLCVTPRSLTICRLPRTTVTDVIHEDGDHLEEQRGDARCRTQNSRNPETSNSQSASTRVMGRLTFGDMYRELPLDDHHKANRKVLGVWGRKVKDRPPGTPVQNVHRALRMSDFDGQGCVTRKATKHDRLFSLIEAAVLEMPRHPPHQQYVGL